MDGSTVRTTACPAGGPSGWCEAKLSWDGLPLACLLFHHATDVDEVVGDDAEPDPALHSGTALVTAAIEPVSPFDDADAPFASGSPFLAIAEPALFLLTLALGALGGAIGDADAFDTSRFRRRLILSGVEPGVCGHKARRAAEPGLMDFDCWNQQVRIARPLIVDFVVDHDLVFCLLQLDHLAELVELAGLALANDFGRGLEHAEELAFCPRVAAEDAFPGLPHHLPHERHHRFQLLAQAFQRQLLQDAPGPLHAFGDLGREPRRLTHYPARRVQ